MTDPADALRALVRDSWSHVAEGYHDYWGPRFAPYLRRALDAFRPAAEGPLAVPGCGPGDEVLALANRWPGRSIVATDPSPAMTAIARRRAREAGLGSILVAEDGAEAVSERVRQAAGVFSSFVLQLLPDPRAALADWSRALRRGGGIAVLFWSRAADGDPFRRLQDLLRRRTGDERPEWEPRLLQELPALGLRLLDESWIEEEMAHPSPEELIRALRERGPFQVLERRLGKDVLDAVCKEWLADHGLEEKAGRWFHRPRAHLWLLEK